MHALLVKITAEHLNIATTAVNLLLVLYAELDHQRLSLITERLVKLGRDVIEPSILSCLNT